MHILGYRDCQQNFYMWQCGVIVAILGAAASAYTVVAPSTVNITLPSPHPQSKLKARKCCPQSHLFNIQQRTCEPKEYKSTASVWENIAGSIDLDNSFGSPECQYGEGLADVLSFANNSIIDQNGQVHLEVNWTPSGFRTKNFCIDAVSGEDDAFLIQVCVQTSLACRHGACIPKCCKLSQEVVDMKCSESIGRIFLPELHELVEIPGQEADLQVVDVVEDARKSFAAGNGYHQMLFAQVVGYPECRQKVVLGEISDLLAGYYVTKDGYLNTPINGSPAIRYPPTDYCLESVLLPNSSEGLVIPIVCYAEENEMPLFEILLVSALSLSCFFLAATLATYAVLPALQNLHGKTLMAHVASLLAAYIFLVVVQVINPTSGSWACKALGFCMLFAFLSAFSWLNIMCIDIWWTFGAVRSSSSSRRRARNRFRAYCIYAWGLPTILTAAGVCVELLAEKDLPWRPELGFWGCWFSYGTHGSLIFFYGPVGGQLLTNLTLFILTVRYCAKVRSEISRLQDSEYSKRTRKVNADKCKLAMCAKLFVVMGVTWAIEVMTSRYDELDHKIEYIVDAPNALQGVIIFCIFVLKRRVLHALAGRFETCRGKNMAGSTLGGNTVALALASESSPSTRSSIRIDDRLVVMRKTPSSATLCADQRGRISTHGSFIHLNPDRNLLFPS